jgi:hypothetical protein
VTLLAFVPGDVAELLRDGWPEHVRAHQIDLAASAALSTIVELGDARAFIKRFGRAPTTVWAPVIAPAETRAWWEAHRMVSRVAPVEGAIDPAVALEYFDRGATIYYKRIETLDAALAGELAALANAAGLPPGHAAVEAFLSPPGTGAPMHFDADYGFNVQIFGEKTWAVQRNRNIRFPIQGCSAVKGPVETSLRYADDLDYPTRLGDDAERIDARPGTVVYLPRGTWHQTRVVGDAPSLAVVFSFRVRTAAQLFAHEIALALARDPAWREPARGWDDVRAALRTTQLDELVAAIAQRGSR